MRRLRWAWAAAAVVGTAPAMVAQEPPVVPTSGTECLPPLRLHHPHRPPARPAMPYAPVMPGTPVDPTKPVDPKQPVDPKRPTDVPPPKDPTAPSTDPTARAPEAGTQPAATLNPNMFGDQFGGTSSPVQLFRTREVSFVLSGIGGGSRTPLPQSNPPLPYIGFFNTTQLSAPGATVIFEDNGRSTSYPAPTFQTTSPLGPGETFFVLESSDVTAGVRRLNPGATVVYVPAFSTAVLQNGFEGGGIYFINQAYDIRTPISFGLAVPNPAGGGVVGRTKLSDDNSPIPRDRLILGGDFFSGAALTRGGIDVTRVSPGIEYTFFDRWTSVELRAPFASTLDPSLTLNGIGGRSAEFGNLNVVLKGLLVRGNEFNLATGLGISLPTGPDTEVVGSDGSNLLRVTNDSFLFAPYLAALFTPGDRFFAQLWTQVSIDPTGSRVFAAGEQVGRLYDQTLFSADVQLGYWAIKNGPGNLLRGLAPFVELHYNTPISDAGTVQANAVTIGATNNYFAEWNLTLGASAQIGTNLLVNAGLVLPLRGGENKFFDYQVGVRANWFFGPTAEARYQADATGGRIEPVGGGGTGTAGGAGAPGGAAAPADPGALARAPEAGTQPAATLNPSMFGDFIGVNARTGGRSAYAQLPVAPRYQGLKLADGENARPSDRAFYTFSRYTDAAGGVNPDGLPELRLTRQVVGLESTIGDNASIGVRLPFLQLDGDPASELREIGDLTVTGKYALYNNRSTGDVFSLGLSVTLPTGGRGPSFLADGTSPPRVAFFQPWAGGVWTSGDTFVQSMAAVVLPGDAVYPTALFGSVGGGYWVYRNETDTLVRGIAPVAELHFNAPLTNRGDGAPMTFNDQVNLTTGVYFALPKLTIGGAVCVPLTGPRPYDLEALLSVNYQF